MIRFLAVLLLAPLLARADEPIDIGSRRELFVDPLLIERMADTSLKLHEPQKLPRTDPPRPSGHYATVLKDNGLFRLYYRGDKVPNAHWKDGWGRYHEGEVTLYAESKDGFQWKEPDLGLHRVPEMPKGNVVLDMSADTFLVTHNFTPFIDTRPGVPAAERYKALGGGRYPPETWGNWKTPDERAKLREKYGPGGLKAFASPDGLSWKLLQKEPVLAEDIGNFDSQNVAFWSAAEGQYVAYFRWSGSGVRGIRRSTSPDFLNWSAPVDMKANLPGEHLYTSGTHPYFRAPHIYIALATRFQANRSSITDIVFLSSRPGTDHYERTFKEAFIRPGLARDGWGNRANYLAWHVVPTSAEQLSMFMFGGDHYVLRTDGFASVHAGYEEGEIVTKPLIFSGTELDINYSTSAAGMMRVEIQDATTGKPVPGFALDDCQKIWGDQISRIVKWKPAGAAVGSGDVGALVGKPVRLRFVMNEADLYSFRFAEPDAGR